MANELRKLHAVKRTGFYLLLFMCLSSALSAQEYLALDSIKMRNHMKFLASDAMEGRETGTEGQRKVAEYLQFEMKSNGLLPLTKDGSFYQPFVLSTVDWDSLSLLVEGKSLQLYRDFVAPTHPNSAAEIQVEEILYLGYGIEDEGYSDYLKNDVENKFLLIEAGEPLSSASDYLISGTDQPTEWTEDISLKLKLASEKGAAGVLIITDDIGDVARRYRTMAMYNRLIIDSVGQVIDEFPPYAFISREQGQSLVGNKQKKIAKQHKKATKKGRFKAIVLKKKDVRFFAKKSVEYTFTENVVGLMRGEDSPENGYIIISAHYDHLGVRGSSVYNGADDNASGTTALLAMMEEMRLKLRDGYLPHKPILFIFMTGEEKGLLGSRYYVENPLLPLDKAYANINIDMIGRIDENHTDGDYVYVIGSDKISTSLDSLIQEVNENAPDSIKLDLDYRFNSDDDPNRFYYRSDHYNFAKNNIPVVFFFTGVHEDYHQPTDTEDKILYKPFVKRARLIYEILSATVARSIPFPRDVE